jgi:hypothetical protein
LEQQAPNGSTVWQTPLIHAPDAHCGLLIHDLPLIKEHWLFEQQDITGSQSPLVAHTFGIHAWFWQDRVPVGLQSSSIQQASFKKETRQLAPLHLEDAHWELIVQGAPLPPKQSMLLIQHCTAVGSHICCPHWFGSGVMHRFPIHVCNPAIHSALEQQGPLGIAVLLHSPLRHTPDAHAIPSKHVYPLNKEHLLFIQQDSYVGQSLVILHIFGRHIPLWQDKLEPLQSLLVQQPPFKRETRQFAPLHLEDAHWELIVQGALKLPIQVVLIQHCSWLMGSHICCPHWFGLGVTHCPLVHVWPFAHSALEQHSPFRGEGKHTPEEPPPGGKSHMPLIQEELEIHAVPVGLRHLPDTQHVEALQSLVVEHNFGRQIPFWQVILVGGVQFESVQHFLSAGEGKQRPMLLQLPDKHWSFVEHGESGKVKHPVEFQQHCPAEGSHICCGPHWFGLIVVVVIGIVGVVVVVVVAVAVVVAAIGQFVTLTWRHSQLNHNDV